MSASSNNDDANENNPTGERATVDEVASETTALQAEIAAALAPKPRKKLVRLKERQRAAERFARRQRNVDAMDHATLLRIYRAHGLVDPQPNAMIAGQPGPPIEPEASGGHDAALFRAFEKAHGCESARLAFSVTIPAHPLGDDVNSTARGMHYLGGYTAIERKHLANDGWPGALVVGTGAFDSITVVGMAPSGIGLFFRPEGGLRAFAAVIENARVAMEEDGLGPADPLPGTADDVARLLAALCHGRVMATEADVHRAPPNGASQTRAPSSATSKRDAARLERWRPPQSHGDVATFAMTLPHWEPGVLADDDWLWCTVDMVAGSLSTERID